MIAGKKTGGGGGIAAYCIGTLRIGFYLHESCVDKKSSFFHWGYSSKKWRIVPKWPLLGSIRRIPSRVTASGYIFRSTFRSLSDV